MKANGLELKTIKTTARTFAIEKPIDTLLMKTFNEKGYIVAWLFNEVLLGYYDGKNCRFYNSKKIEDRYLLRLRIFNESKELYVWRTGEGLKARLRMDGEGEESSVIDACQVLWGTEAEPLGDFTCLKEKRGTTLIVPVKNALVNDERKRLFIKTRNYIGFTPSFQATYIDCRFIEFTDTFIREDGNE